MVYLSLGSNIGAREQNLADALSRLQSGGLVLRQVSPAYYSAAVDCEPGAPEFVNIAAAGEWSGSPESLLDLCQAIEAALGRPNDHGYHLSRTIDIDIIFFDDLVINTPRLIVPHPRWQERDFVTVPLKELGR